MPSTTKQFYSVFITAAALVGLILALATPLATKTYLAVVSFAFVFGCLIATQATKVFVGEEGFIPRMAKIAPVYPFCAAAFVALELVRHPDASWAFVVGLYAVAGLLLIPGAALMTAFLGRPE